jgi:hypothetical protein
MAVLEAVCYHTKAAVQTQERLPALQGKIALASTWLLVASKQVIDV